MNLALWPTALIGSALFWLGTIAERKLAGQLCRRIFVIIAVILAIPGALFAIYYTKLMGEPIWFYEFRSMTGTELSAAGLGLIAGYLNRARHRHPLLKRQLRAFTVPVIFSLVLAAPFVKPMLRPSGQFQDQWKNGVCIQSTPSSCGPASAATIARFLGKNITEAELAHESLTYFGGTENWYLARALRKRGFNVEFRKLPANSENFPTPATAGVKLAQGTGHFIALISRDGTNYVAGDPLTGKEVAPLSELRSEYTFTGFFLVIK
jgi:hypothetical protein